jgi:hypothetical protein
LEASLDDLQQISSANVAWFALSSATIANSSAKFSQARSQESA